MKCPACDQKDAEIKRLRSEVDRLTTIKDALHDIVDAMEGEKQ